MKKCETTKSLDGLNVNYYKDRMRQVNVREKVRKQFLSGIHNDIYNGVLLKNLAINFNIKIVFKAWNLIVEVIAFCSFAWLTTYLIGLTAKKLKNKIYNLIL